MSPIYQKFKEFKLTQNMRTDEAELEFSEYILGLGNGIEENITEISEYTIMIPNKYLVANSNTLIEKVFPDLTKQSADCKLLIKGTIYTPLNTNMKKLNAVCISRFPGSRKTYLSSDTLLQSDQQDSIPAEFLNSLTPSGMPDHELVLKEL